MQLKQFSEYIVEPNGNEEESLITKAHHIALNHRCALFRVSLTSCYLLELVGRRFMPKILQSYHRLPHTLIEGTAVVMGSSGSTFLRKLPHDTLRVTTLEWQNSVYQSHHSSCSDEERCPRLGEP